MSFAEKFLGSRNYDDWRVVNVYDAAELPENNVEFKAKLYTAIREAWGIVEQDMINDPTLNPFVGDREINNYLEEAINGNDASKPFVYTRILSLKRSCGTLSADQYDANHMARSFLSKLLHETVKLVTNPDDSRLYIPDFDADVLSMHLQRIEKNPKKSHDGHNF